MNEYHKWVPGYGGKYSITIAGIVYRHRQKSTLKLRYNLNSSDTIVQLSKIYNVGATTISDVINRKTWKHI